MRSPPPQKTIVVGAGPVGCLAAIYAAARGHQVELYELRGDLRDPSVTPLNFTRSINLALSERGINAIKHANRRGLLESILSQTIPMHGRMIHGKKEDGQLTEQSQSYDIHGRSIKAADRGELNKRLLDELDSMENVRVFFNHKLVGADFQRNLAWFERQDHSRKSNFKGKPGISEVEIDFDFLIGADGAHSAVRYHLMKFTRVDYQQTYIDSLWCEFHVEPKESPKGPEFKLSPNHLHIWPGGDFMFIAIPSDDRSFTSTLFMSANKFNELDQDPDSVVPFFQKNFPGVVPDLITEDDIIEQYTMNPHLPLLSIKCSSYHHSSSVVILGDAAHAMVPFYGQGMNAGLEDVRILFEHIDKATETTSTIHFEDSTQRTLANDDARASALESYSKERYIDSVAICDLALANYTEMSSHVRSPLYLLRKRIEEGLSTWLPSLGWATQYSRVSFENERYSIVQASARRQQKVLRKLVSTVAGGLVGAVIWGVWMTRNRFGSTVLDRVVALWKSSGLVSV